MASVPPGDVTEAGISIILHGARSYARGQWHVQIMDDQDRVLCDIPLPDLTIDETLPGLRHGPAQADVILEGVADHARLMAGSVSFMPLEVGTSITNPDAHIILPALQLLLTDAIYLPSVVIPYGGNVTVPPPPTPPPANVSPPVISGTARVGSTLTAVVGNWTNAAAFAYQWTRNGAAIPNANGLTYVQVAADMHARIGFIASATNPVHTTPVSAAAVEVGPVIGLVTFTVPRQQRVPLLFTADGLAPENNVLVNNLTTNGLKLTRVETQVIVVPGGGGGGGGGGSDADDTTTVFDWTEAAATTAVSLGWAGSTTYQTDGSGNLITTSTSGSLGIYYETGDAVNHSIECDILTQDVGDMHPLCVSYVDSSNYMFARGSVGTSTGATGTTINLRSVIAGTATIVGSWTVTTQNYAAPGARLKLVKRGTTYKLYVNGTYVGPDITYSNPAIDGGTKVAIRKAASNPSEPWIARTVVGAGVDSGGGGTPVVETRDHLYELTAIGEAGTGALSMGGTVLAGSNSAPVYGTDYTFIDATGTPVAEGAGTKDGIRFLTKTVYLRAPMAEAAPFRDYGFSLKATLQAGAGSIGATVSRALFGLGHYSGDDQGVSIFHATDGTLRATFYRLNTPAPVVTTFSSGLSLRSGPASIFDKHEIELRVTPNQQTVPPSTYTCQFYIDGVAMGAAKTDLTYDQFPQIGPSANLRMNAGGTVGNTTSGTLDLVDFYKASVAYSVVTGTGGGGGSGTNLVSNPQIGASTAGYTKSTLTPNAGLLAENGELKLVVDPVEFYGLWITPITVVAGTNYEVDMIGRTNGEPGGDWFFYVSTHPQGDWGGANKPNILVESTAKTNSAQNELLTASFTAPSSGTLYLVGQVSSHSGDADVAGFFDSIYVGPPGGYGATTETVQVATDLAAGLNTLTRAQAEAALHGNALTLNPANDLAGGTAEFRWVATDGFTYGEDWVFTVPGSVVGPTQRPPVATDDAVTTTEGTPVTFDPRTNDTDPDGDPISVTAVTQGSKGIVTFTASSVTYTPNAGQTGADSFTYTISSTGGTDVGAVSVTIFAAGQAPLTAQVDMPDQDYVSLGLGALDAGITSLTMPTTFPRNIPWIGTYSGGIFTKVTPGQVLNRSQFSLLHAKRRLQITKMDDPWDMTANTGQIIQRTFRMTVPWYIERPPMTHAELDGIASTWRFQHWGVSQGYYNRWLRLKWDTYREGDVRNAVNGSDYTNPWAVVPNGTAGSKVKVDVTNLVASGVKNLTVPMGESSDTPRALMNIRNVQMILRGTSANNYLVFHSANAASDALKPVLIFKKAGVEVGRNIAVYTARTSTSASDTDLSASASMSNALSAASGSAFKAHAFMEFDVMPVGSYDTVELEMTISTRSGTGSTTDLYLARTGVRAPRTLTRDPTIGASHIIWKCTTEAELAAFFRPASWPADRYFGDMKGPITGAPETVKPYSEQIVRIVNVGGVPMVLTGIPMWAIDNKDGAGPGKVKFLPRIYGGASLAKEDQPYHKDLWLRYDLCLQPSWGMWAYDDPTSNDGDDDGMGGADGKGFGLLANTYKSDTPMGYNPSGDNDPLDLIGTQVGGMGGGECDPATFTPRMKQGGALPPDHPMIGLGSRAGIYHYYQQFEGKRRNPADAYDTQQTDYGKVFYPVGQRFTVTQHVKINSFNYDPTNTQVSPGGDRIYGTGVQDGVVQVWIDDYQLRNDDGTVILQDLPNFGIREAAELAVAYCGGTEYNFTYAQTKERQIALFAFGNCVVSTKSMGLGPLPAGL